MVIAFVPASIMAEGEEAKIGGQPYSTVEEALTDAKDGQTVELLKDVETSTGYTVPDGVTLDGGSKTITVKSAVNGVTLNGTSIVRNVTIKTPAPAKYAVQAYATTNAVIELAKGDNVIENPVVTVDGRITSSDANVSPIYVDVNEITSPVVDQLVKVTDNANGMITPDSKLEFGTDRKVVVTEPSAPACAGEKDKNCDGVVTCDEEKGTGWTWNNSTKVCEFTGSTGYTVVNTAAK